MSDHPDFNNLRSLGTTWYDPSSEPGRWQVWSIKAGAPFFSNLNAI